VRGTGASEDQGMEHKPKPKKKQEVVETIISGGIGVEEAHLRRKPMYADHDDTPTIRAKHWDRYPHGCSSEYPQEL